MEILYYKCHWEKWPAFFDCWCLHRDQFKGQLLGGKLSANIGEKFLSVVVRLASLSTDKPRLSSKWLSLVISHRVHMTHQTDMWVDNILHRLLDCGIPSMWTQSSRYMKAQIDSHGNHCRSTLRTIHIANIGRSVLAPHVPIKTLKTPKPVLFVC